MPYDSALPPQFPASQSTLTISPRVVHYSETQQPGPEAVNQRGSVENIVPPRSRPLKFLIHKTYSKMLWRRAAKDQSSQAYQHVPPNEYSKSAAYREDANDQISQVYQHVPPVQYYQPAAYREAANTQNSQVYQPVPPTEYYKTATYKEEEIQKPPRRPKHSWASIIFTQVCGFLWIVPVAYLMYLNWSKYVIGPSAWCPRGNCEADPLAKDAVGKAQRYDKHDHNTLGALQFVAKALELWFIFVAGLLLYNVTMLLAAGNHGLPIGLLTSPVEFADPRSLIDTIRAANRSRHQRTTSVSIGSKFILGSFILLVAFMCLIVNLMGPAVAVLVLPTLQWVELEKNASHSLKTFHLGDMPESRVDDGMNGTVFPNCGEEWIRYRMFSCTDGAYAASLDTWVDATVAGNRQIVSYNNNTMWNGVSPEGRVFFTFNFTNNITDVAWAPNRQMLREISSDLDLFLDANSAAQSSDGQYVEQYVAETNDPTLMLDKTTVSTVTDDYKPYINSLQTLLKRQGPIAGALGNVYFPSNYSFTTLGDYKWVRCFEGYSSYLPGLDKFNGEASYTKCLKLGTDWSPTYQLSNFSVVGDNASASVNIYFSDKATYLAEGLDPKLLNACRTNSSSATGELCPWETIFDDDHLPDYMGAMRSNLLTVELTMPIEYPGQYVVLEAVTYVYNGTYTLDTSPVSNPNYLVQVDGLPDIAMAGLKPVTVDPDWLLAAWSVDYDGTLYANRSAATNLIRGLEAYFSNTAFSEQGSGGNYDYTSSYASYFATASAEPGDNLPSSTLGTFATETEFPSSVFSDFLQSSIPTETSGLFKRQESITSAVPTPTSTSSVTSILPVRPDDYENSDYNDGWYGASVNTDDPEQGPDDLVTFIYFSYLQALSMVSFDKNNLTAPNTDPHDTEHPTLNYWAQVHVWAYGLDSRTSKFGFAVAAAGCLCVIASTIMGMFVRRRQRSLTELIVAAIEHKHQGELDHANGDDALAARFRYRIQEDQTDGRVRFQPL